jgi:tetratricopeptide (TPR) repeat protein
MLDSIGSSVMRNVVGRSGLVMLVCLIASVGTLPLAGRQVSSQALYDQAGQAFDAGDTAKAIKLYEELLQQAPNSVDARINLGAALAHEGRYDEAIQQYRTALSHDPGNETGLLNLGLAWYKQGDFRKAHDRFEQLRKLHPANRQAFYLLADCDLRLGKFKDAIALVEPVYQTHPGDETVDYILGTALIQDGQANKGAAVIDHIMRNGNPAVATALVGTAQFAAQITKPPPLL